MNKRELGNEIVYLREDLKRIETKLDANEKKIDENEKAHQAHARQVQRNNMFHIWLKVLIIAAILVGGIIQGQINYEILAALAFT